MRRFLLAQFSPVLQAWRNGYEGEVRRSVIAFFVLIFLAFGVCLAVPEVRLGLSAYLQGFYHPLALFLNNLRACVVTMLYGLIPYVRMPALALGMNAVVLGGMAAVYAAADSTMLLFAAGLLPHGIFELPALILSFSMGLYVCGHLTRRVRGDSTALSLRRCASLSMRLLVFLVLPLLILAAVTEAYVTPLVMGLFL